MKKPQWLDNETSLTCWTGKYYIVGQYYKGENTMNIQEITELRYLSIRILRLLKENNDQLLTDSIMTEFNKTYEWFIYQSEDLRPDVF